MAKPQQPDLHRSGHTPVDPDHASEVATTRGDRPVPPGGAPVPEDNRPGHHPQVEQDKPPLDQFAEALGIVADAEDAADAAAGDLAASRRPRPGSAGEPVRALTLEHPARPLLHRTWTTVADVLVLPALGLAGGAIEALEKVVVRTRDAGAPAPPVDRS